MYINETNDRVLSLKKTGKTQNLTQSMQNNIQILAFWKQVLWTNKVKMEPHLLKITPCQLLSIKADKH